MHGARNVGGGEYILYLVIKNLRRDIFHPIVFYARENEIIKRLKEEDVELIRVPLNEKIISVYRDEIKKDPGNLLIYAYHLMNEIYKVIRLLTINKVDILHPHDNLSKIIGGIAAKIARVKVVAHCHDLLRNNLIDKMLLIDQLLFLDRIIAVSESVGNLFKILGRKSKKVCTIYNGIDLNKFDYETRSLSKEELNLSDDHVVIGVIGMFDRIKGHEYLFKAVEKLVFEGRTDIICLVVGEGRMRNELEEFVSSRNLGRNIRFLGYRNDIPELLKVMDVVVVPSLQESFGMVPVEAMAMKIPVIATRVGGLVEVIEDGKTGILVPPGDVGSLCMAIKQLIENPEMRKEMGEAGKKRVEEKFDILVNVRKTEQLYLECLIRK